MKTHTGTGSSEILFSGGSTFRHPVATKSRPVNEFSRVTFSTKLYQRKFDNNNCLFYIFHIFISFFRDICDLAEKYNALTFIDECHGTGVIGQTGRYVFYSYSFKNAQKNLHTGF